MREKFDRDDLTYVSYLELDTMLACGSRASAARA
jgi:hypothetical protein